MIRRLFIQNFLSIPSATVTLEDITLLIGPNNSGKSNLLRALETLANLVNSDYRAWNAETVLRQSFGRNEDWITLGVEGSAPEGDWVYAIMYKAGQGGSIRFLELAGVLREGKVVDIQTIHDPSQYEHVFHAAQINTVDGPFDYDKFSTAPKHGETQRDFSIVWAIDHNKGIRQESSQPSPGKMQTQSAMAWVHEAYRKAFRHHNIYYLFSQNFLKEREPKYASRISTSGSNLVQFLFYIDQNYPRNFEELKRDLAETLGDIVNIRTPLDTDNQLTFKFFDKNGADYKIDEVSEGVKYFLAFLALIHQPEPPALLLIEEPENGIHPRRINQLIDYLRRLALSRGLQVIMTSHSPVVLDQFEDEPEAVYVFDRDEAGTQIRNLRRDILDVQEQNYLEATGKNSEGWDRMLSDKWLAGILNGVPND